MGLWEEDGTEIHVWLYTRLTHIKSQNQSQSWFWLILTMLALEKLRQEEYPEFRPSLRYTVGAHLDPIEGGRR